MNQLRWKQLCQACGIDNQKAIEQEFNRIATAYGQAQRAYHTAQHINECLAWLDWAKGEIPAEYSGHWVLEMALWYHDVVYLPRRSDNERRSADQAMGFLRAHLPGQPGKDGQIHRIEALIMATIHGGDPGTGPCSKSGGEQGADLLPWMVDIDLAILGAEPQRFTQYETQIRREYGWVPEAIYRVKRRHVLGRFLGRPMVYRTALFRQRFESQARQNLGCLSF